MVTQNVFLFVFCFADVGTDCACARNCLIQVITFYMFNPDSLFLMTRVFFPYILLAIISCLIFPFFYFYILYLISVLLASKYFYPLLISMGLSSGSTFFLCALLFTYHIFSIRFSSHSVRIFFIYFYN